METELGRIQSWEARISSFHQDIFCPDELPAVQLSTKLLQLESQKRVFSSDLTKQDLPSKWLVTSLTHS